MKKFNSTADIVRKLLKENKMTQGTLAKRLDIPFRVLSAKFCEASDLKYRDFEMYVESIGFELALNPTMYFRVGPGVYNAMIYSNKWKNMDVPHGIWCYDHTQVRPFRAMARKAGVLKCEDFDNKQEMIVWLKNLSYESTE